MTSPMQNIGASIKESIRGWCTQSHSKRRMRSLALATAIPVLASVLLTTHASAQSVTVSVDWNNALKTIDSGAWGIDNPAFMDPAATASSSWMSLVNDITLKKPLIRIHGWGMMAKDGTGWLNADGSWNASRITSALTPVINAGYTIMIDVPDGPNTGSLPDPDLIGNPDKVATWMASLVQIVNVTDHFNVKYWEFPNERDPNCTSGALSSAQMSTLLSKVSRAMKAKDSTIKFGGPATCWINGGYIQDSISGIVSDIDFVTCHIYGGDGTGSSPQPDYDSAQNDSASIADMRTRMNTISPGKYIPIYLDEYNISYNSSPWNKTSDGAVYDVLEATGAIHSGADTTQFWEMSTTDDWHSLIQNLTTRYPISNNWTMLNQYFYGQEMSATTSNRALVDKFAAKSTSGGTTTYALVLVNRSDSTQTVGLTYTNFTPASLNKYVIDSSGFSGPTAVGWPVSGGLSMAPRTIAYLIGTSGGGGTSGPVSINSGGPAAGSFIADADFSGGGTATNWTGAIDTSAAANPAPQAVYQSERYGNNTYTIGGLTPSTNYTVRLHFCENYWTAAGARKFNVSINGTQVLTNFDIFATAGAAHKAVTQQFTAAANGSGQIVIVYTTVTDNALSSGVEVLAGAAPPVPTGLTATAGSTQVALSWSVSSGATAYDVKRSTVSGSGYATVSSPATNSYTNTGLTNGTTYYFVVDAKNASGTSANSSQVSATPAATTLPIQINVGGSAAAPYATDNYFSGGSTDAAGVGHTINTAGVTNPAPQAVYQNLRWGVFTYTIPGLTPGTNYTVRLHFCENWWTASGQRVFNVSINGTQVLTNFDVFAAAGGQYIAVVRSFTATANSSGQVVISTSLGTADNPIINGIEILALAGPPAPTGLTATQGNAQVALAWTASSGATSYNVYRGTAAGGESGTAIATGIATTTYTNTGLTNGTRYYYTVKAVNSGGTSGASNEANATPTVPVQINCGGAAAAPYIADADFSGGSTDSAGVGHTIDTTGITNPAPQAVYQYLRWGVFTYTIPGLHVGSVYTVRLHFSENWWTAANQRAFNVSINGTQVLTNFDVFATAGAQYKAVVKTFTATANGSGQVVITTAVGTHDNPSINGIEVY